MKAELNQSVDKIYLPGLNGLRAIAATAVVLSHISLNLPKFGLQTFGGLDAANFGVTIFFALSGFLITYLLLVERAFRGDVNIGKFYARRIARIWPLYFLYLSLVVLYWGGAVMDNRLLWYLLFTPNVAFVIGQSIPLLAHYWSLGVEEQFYLVWPWVAKYGRMLTKVLIVFVLAFIVAKLLVKFSHLDKAYAFLHYSRFGCMAIGALAANALHNGHWVCRLVAKPWLQWICWLLYALVAINRFHIASIIDHEILAIATAVIILSQVQSVSIFSLENRLLNYLGKISFGMYVFNPLIIEVLSLLTGNILPKIIWLRFVMIFTIVPFLVVAVSHISFNYFERWFLRWKEKFAVVKT
ncbi:MAG: acyltransferase [Chryseolinea sp.]